MPKLFSYVVEHDYGRAPCAVGRYCTLAKCKYGSEGYKNVVELAEVGDWIAGTGGVRKAVSAGHGKLIYAMRVDEKLPLAAYCDDRRFRNRPDTTHDLPKRGRFALISRHFFYFGRNAIEISEIPSQHLDRPFEKRGPGFRSDFSLDFINDFAAWLERTFRVGVHGSPCGKRAASPKPECRARRC